jgi:ribosome-binding protein aMBF1 (putative translation factor)
MFKEFSSIGGGAKGSKSNTPYYDCGSCGKKISLNNMKLDSTKMAVCLDCYEKIKSDPNPHSSDTHSFR